MSARTRASVAVAAGLALATALLAASPAAAEPDEGWLQEPTPPADWPTASTAQLDDSVMVFDLRSITTFTTDGSVSAVDTTETDGDTVTISLATDILFAPDEWELPASADAKIAELVADVPDGATVQVTGHTDSVDGAVDNQELSENRAQAVADVIAEVRPDLDLEVSGLADTRPAVAEDPDDPSSYAANRRVEIVYEG